MKSKQLTPPKFFTRLIRDDAALGKTYEQILDQSLSCFHLSN